MMEKNKKPYFVRLLILIAFGVLNILSTRSPFLGLLITVFEYLMVFVPLLNKNTYQSFVYFIAFATISLEMDSYIYLGGEAPFQRYSFFHVPIAGPFLFIFTSFLIFVAVLFPRLIPISKQSSLRKLSNHLKWLTITGGISIMIGLALNDNGIASSPIYPTAAIIEFLYFLELCAVIGTAAVIVQKPHRIDTLSKDCQCILLAVAFSSVIGLLMGFTGVYVNDGGKLLASLSIAFVPLLILFTDKETCLFPLLNQIASILIVLIAFFFPIVIGSKWYLVLFLTLSGWFAYTMNVRSFWGVAGLSLLGLIAIYFFSGTLVDFMSGDEFNSWKFSQAISMINIFSYSSFEQWFLSLEQSPAFRIDELWNIGIEYAEKPLYALFGKGFGGTTAHHTILLEWERGNGTFSQEQIAMGAYYAMHESSAIIFLRHGLYGMFFFVATFILLFKRIKFSAWSLVGMVWFLFYWSFGLSLQIGAVALVLALVDNSIISKQNGASKN